MSIIISILIFSIIVVFHEYGHFLFARRAGIYVEEFALGMGPKLFGKQIGETMFSVRAIPFGGYCKMLGEDDPTLKDDRAFAAKTVWQRFLVVIGGPLFNFIMAFAFAIVLLSISGISTTKVEKVMDDMPAKEAGILVGDKIVSFNDRKIIKNSELQNYLHIERADEVKIGVIRNGEKLIIPIKPKVNENGRVLIGVVFGSIENANIFDIIKHSFIELAYMVRLVFYSLGKLISGGVSVKQMMGPVGLVSAISTGYKSASNYGIKSVIAVLSYFIVLLSANLGVMNLLPLPALDGGRLVFIIYEGIAKKPLNPKYEGTIHLVGFVLLMALMIFILYNDIVRLITGN